MEYFGLNLFNLRKYFAVLLGVCSCATHFIKIFQLVLISKATFIFCWGRGEGQEISRCKIYPGNLEGLHMIEDRVFTLTV